jgi:hypothetical protein
MLTDGWMALSLQVEPLPRLSQIMDMCATEDAGHPVFPRVGSQVSTSVRLRTVYRKTTIKLLIPSPRQNAIMFAVIQRDVPASRAKEVAQQWYVQ